jgi:hypothetical protein
LKQLSKLTAEAVHQALVSSPRVWVYPVSSLHGKKAAGLVAFSREYLQDAVARGIADDPAFKLVADGTQWLQTHLPVEIERVLSRHNVRTGYAVLAGVARPVWVLPQAEIKLQKGKALRAQLVEVVEHI